MEEMFRFTVDKRPIGSDVAHSLSVECVEIEDSGLIKALATNKAGTDITEAKFVVEGIFEMNW